MMMMMMVFSPSSSSLPGPKKMKKKKRKNDAHDVNDEIPICSQTPEMMPRDERAKSTCACLFCIPLQCGVKMDKMERRSKEETLVELMNSNE